MGESCFGGVEIGGTRVRCAIGAGPDDLRAERCIATSQPAETFDRIVDFFREHSDLCQVSAVGVACFGPLDLGAASSSFGFITRTPKAGWSGVDVAGTLARALGVPVVIDTDVNGAALAERSWGDGIGCDPLVYITVGTGIGGGAIVGGRCLHGLVHPEMGHMRVPRDPADRFAGVCPFHGDCLEGLASGPAILARRGLPGEALAVDDPVWALEARYLAFGIVNVVGVLSPCRIIVGGGVMRQPSLLPRVRADVQRLLAGYVRAPAVIEAIERYIVPPALGERVGVLGALALARQGVTSERA